MTEPKPKRAKRVKPDPELVKLADSLLVNYKEKRGREKGTDLFFVTGIQACFVLGSVPVIKNVSNTFCPSRTASRISRNVNSLRMTFL